MDCDPNTKLIGYASCLLDHKVRLNGIEIYGDLPEDVHIIFPRITLPDSTTELAFESLHPTLKSQIEIEILHQLDPDIVSIKAREPR